MDFMDALAVKLKVIISNYPVQFMTLHLIIYIIVGKSIKLSSGGTVRVYPYDTSNPTGPKRTHLETLEEAKQASLTCQPVSV